MPPSLPPANASGALLDLFLSLKAGLRDCVRPSILAISVLIFTAVFLGCSVLLVIFWDEIMTFCSWLSGGALTFLLALLPGYTEGSAAVAVNTGLPELLRSLMSWLLLGIFYVLTVMVSMRLAMEFILMHRISLQIRKQYPDLEARGGLKDSLILLAGSIGSFVVLAPLLLILPLIGGPLLFILGGYLMVRSLSSDALEDIADAREVGELLRTNRLGILLLGSLLSVLIVIPPLGLLAPGLIGSSVCHYFFRRLRVLRQLEQTSLTMANSHRGVVEQDT